MMDEMDDDDAHQDTPRAFLDCSISRLAFAKVTFQVGRPAIKWHLLPAVTEKAIGPLQQRLRCTSAPAQRSHHNIVFSHHSLDSNNRGNHRLQ